MANWLGLVELFVVFGGVGVLYYYQVWKNPYEIEKRENRKRLRAEKKAAGRER
ncbi:hypothetical protein U0C82_02780 [Fulvimarina sp. 2208YS6-2-32]|uniref:Uncharacterized protein n=1 Tax=Fulvimarina uroteuthidis TaxID=3098149 RepID=A0ABU5HY62_9HYPH|nr:hypothetical protein [Fulvimarina sp. 2208YS6-2-32]MDY8108073.1 hypothetical protein [Fulvimarina sp. 2208YS6-2-32]